MALEFLCMKINNSFHENPIKNKPLRLQPTLYQAVLVLFIGTHCGEEREQASHNLSKSYIVALKSKEKIIPTNLAHPSEQLSATIKSKERRFRNRVSTLRPIIEPLGLIKNTINTSFQGNFHLMSSATAQIAESSDLSLLRVDFKHEADINLFKSIPYVQEHLIFMEPNKLSNLHLINISPISSKAKSGTPMKDKMMLESPNIVKLIEYYTIFSPPWWFSKIHLIEAYRLLKSKQEAREIPANKEQGPVIAVLDSGIDYRHPGLKKGIWINPLPGASGCHNDRYGCDVTKKGHKSLGEGPALPFSTQNAGDLCPGELEQDHISSSCAHGTHVAGIIMGDYHFGVTGVCPFCKVLSIKVVEEVDQKGKVADSSILKALIYIQNINRTHGNIVRIVNASFGKYEQSLAISLLVKELNESGVLFIGASGNENSQARVFPAALPSSVSVTAIGKSGKKAPYANFGSWVDIAAPGGNLKEGFEAAIISASPGGGIHAAQGTSSASPIVAATAGLSLILDPSLTAGQLRNALLDSASPEVYSPSFANGYNSQFYSQQDDINRKSGLLGAGLLNAEAILKSTRRSDYRQGDSLRIKGGCGAIFLSENFLISRSSPIMLIILILIPMSSIWWGRKRSSYE